MGLFGTNEYSYCRGSEKGRTELTDAQINSTLTALGITDIAKARKALEKNVWYTNSSYCNGPGALAVFGGLAAARGVFPRGLGSGVDCYWPLVGTGIAMGGAGLLWMGMQERRNYKALKAGQAAGAAMSPDAQAAHLRALYAGQLRPSFENLGRADAAIRSLHALRGQTSKKPPASSK